MVTPLSPCTPSVNRSHQRRLAVASHPGAISVLLELAGLLSLRLLLELETGLLTEFTFLTFLAELALGLLKLLPRLL